VSPRIESVPEALHVVFKLFARGGASTCKIGRNLFGLLRPDKLVVYFKRFEDLEAAADRLQRELDGMPAHGVPFTAEIAGRGRASSHGALIQPATNTYSAGAEVRAGVFGSPTA
jgi:hypothetical protein